MTYKEEILRNKLLNNEFIEENSDWIANDEYYGKSKDYSLNNYIQENINSTEGIKNIVFRFYQLLKERYHNNFYLEYNNYNDKIIFHLRGQPIFDQTPLNLVVKYNIEFNKELCKLSSNFIIPESSEYNYEKNLVINFKEKSSIGLFDKIKSFAQGQHDNTEEIRQIINSLPIPNNFKQSPVTETPNINTNIKKENIKNSNDNSIKENEKATKNEQTEQWSDERNDEYSIYCPNCGKANYPLNHRCSVCDTLLVSYLIDYGNEFNSFEELLSDKNLEIINKTEIPVSFYDYLVNSIVQKSSDPKLTDDMNVFDKILYVSRYYVNIRPNDQIKTFGMYDFNTVLLNPNYSRSLQSSTLIKYLSIDLYIEILEGIFMYIFDVKNNNYVKSFIDFIRYANQMENFIQRYFSARVEASFIPKEYQNYEEVEQLYFSGIFDEKALHSGLLIGNTYAQEIIKILNQILNSDVKKELANQFEIDNEDTTEAIRQFNINETLNKEDMLITIKESMIETMKLLKNNEKAYNSLLEMKKNFDEMDKTNRQAS